MLIFLFCLGDAVKNVPLELKLSIPGHTHIEQSLLHSCRSSNPDISEAVISLGQMDLSTEIGGSEAIQLRPVTDDAAQTLLNAKENNVLFDMVLGMLKKVNIPRESNNDRPLQIRVQVYYSKSQATKTSEFTFSLMFLLPLLWSICVFNKHTDQRRTFKCISEEKKNQNSLCFQYNFSSSQNVSKSVRSLSLLSSLKAVTF